MTPSPDAATGLLLMALIVMAIGFGAIGFVVGLMF